mmetsp:Transcript_3909/g.5921  ORF Transcript_3909/g.5921 Transcript_3909/m.5921 type:complete len:114 (+) Transcript_3909:19-360(+)
MEYNFSESDEVVDLEKVSKINEIGSKWSNLNCDFMTDPKERQKCKRIREITISYGQDVMKIQEKSDSCQAILEEGPLYKSRLASYRDCTEQTEKSIIRLVNKYYNHFVQADNS